MATQRKKVRVKRLPARERVPEADRWDLSSLFRSDSAWQRAMAKWEQQIGGYEPYRGRLSSSAETLAACLQFDSDLDRAAERLAYYAHLKTAEDSANAHYQGMMARFVNVASRAEEAASFMRPEILAIPAAKLKKFLAKKVMQPWRLAVERLVRFKPYTLSKNEERLLAMQSEMAQTSHHTFEQLHNSDMRFAVVRDEKGSAIELGHGNLSKFMESPRRSVRRKAYQTYYGKFEDYRHTLAATLTGSIQKDVYYAKARGYDSALAAALFGDNVPPAVYDNLIATVNDHLPALHKYYALRNKKLRLKKFSLYDQYVSLVPQAKMRHRWEEAVDVILNSLQPLGPSYCRILEGGLNNGWCDRYPNRGKASGAFSAGSFDGDPYILMNFQPDVLNDVFTLTHEAGHSMHSYYSARHQPYPYYQYTIFVAEVASTFNEQLLTRFLLQRARNDTQRAMLLNREIDNIRGTIYRQTMFAEFEKKTHAMCEAGEPLTLETLQEIYRELLIRYLGDQLELDPYTLLECLRIPHFYRAFYVYKYATGMSAAMALADRVLQGGRGELDNYLNFLKAGCTKYPLELLQDAGVDMTSSQPIATALTRFDQIVDQLAEIV
ncbi:MAG: oligoendopeptidase F [Planctomycetales bacterium]|nr:oligoendopeptidase F [Planctomycetales bacterium]NIM08026.1 oligoendopeptidase F [Planctomycetales bacterium]NIN07517.1 oligoendopeptidase F [Planctomycetales bacterium]NIN76624.1 oligoendopeptidase F [Planctomycetales bacterium]NIO33811.1 oligoendopeptidase F [Planctomycetales bacterium]